jgi:hypothetical protein
MLTNEIFNKPVSYENSPILRDYDTTAAYDVASMKLHGTTCNQSAVLVISSSLREDYSDQNPSYSDENLHSRTQKKHDENVRCCWALLVRFHITADV